MYMNKDGGDGKNYAFRDHKVSAFLVITKMKICCFPFDLQ